MLLLLLFVSVLHVMLNCPRITYCFFVGDVQLDTDEVTVENALSRSFHKLLQIQLDPVWHRLGPDTKQLLSDLKTLRHLLL